ncbi:MAG: class I SAM-dependent methyltransferase [Flavisolibacter sp.]
MSVREWFKEWFNSPYYHKLYFERDEKEAQQFIQRLVDLLSPQKEARMLDVACGRGRHSRFLASLGYDVTGIDISPDSIQYAQQFEAENLHFYQHDMRLPFRINYFNYTFNFFTSFGYFATRREHNDSIRTMVNSLHAGGVLVLDYLNVHYVEERLVHNEIKNINDTSYEIHRWQDNKQFCKKIIIHNPTLDEAKEFTEHVAKLYLGDFIEMLSFYKMQIMDVFGDYYLNKYDLYKMPRMVIVARKGEGS